MPSLNVLENTALPASFGPRRATDGREQAAALLTRLGLAARLGVYPRQLSAGEQKRVVLARALMNQPEILLADEPTSDLDERTEAEIMAVLRERHAEGTTILMVTHAATLIPYANRTLRMEEGRLVEFKPTAPAE
jgi:ABC-type lipoprotein export system ATPase subunit